MAEKAQFFWHGRALSLYEESCLLSFLKNGFEVDLYLYQPVDVPDGVQIKEASEILPPRDLTRYTQAGQPANLAAFSDAFRYELLKKKGGWWFDTDVFCLREVTEFQNAFTSTMPYVACRLNEWLESANLKINDKNLFNTIDQLLEKAGTEFEWGAIGPKLVTEAVRKQDMDDWAVPSYYFSPVLDRDTLALLLPSKKSEMQIKCSSSYTLHFYHEYFSRWKIPLNVPPPEGSLLWDLFLEVNPALSSLPALPADTAVALTEAAFQHEEWKRLKRQEERIKNTFLYQSLKRLKGLITSNG